MTDSKCDMIASTSATRVSPPSACPHHHHRHCLMLQHVVCCAHPVSTSLFFSALFPCRVPVYLPCPHVCCAELLQLLDVSDWRLSTDIRQCQNTFSGSCSVVLHFLFFIVTYSKCTKSKKLSLILHVCQIINHLQSSQLFFSVVHFQEEKTCPFHQSFPRSSLDAETHFSCYLLFPCHLPD